MSPFQGESGRTIVVKRRSIVAAMSSHRPACTADVWIIVLRGATSQSNRSRLGSLPIGPAAAPPAQMIEMLADQIPEVPRKTARKQAMAAVATMMGTLVLSRIAGSGEFSDEILGAGREAVLERATPPKRAAKKIAKLATH